MSRLRCPDSGKVGYLDEHDAQRALRKTQAGREKAYRTRAKVKRRELGNKWEGAGLIGASVARRERRVYECDCGLFHLTSQRGRVDVSTMNGGGWGA